MFRFQSPKLFRFSAPLLLASNNNNNNNNNNFITTSQNSTSTSTPTTTQLSARATVDTLSKLLEGGHINAFCSILRDGFFKTERLSTTTSSENGGSVESSNHQQIKTNQNPVFLSSSSSAIMTNSFDSSSTSLLIESLAPFSNQYQKQMRNILRKSVHDALVISNQQQQLQQKSTISTASWMVIANVAVSQGMWIRSLEIFDKLVAGGSSTTNQNKTNSFTISNRPPPAPHTIAQTLRPGNISIIRKWCKQNNAKLDIVTGMKVLVEYSDDWAAALRLALEEERQPQGAPRGACESYSLGVLIPYLANGGHWTTASAVLADALARGSLVSDSLVQMILKSTAQQKTWVSCLALTSSLSSCFAITVPPNTTPSTSSAKNNSNNNQRPGTYGGLLATLRSVAAVCRTWEQACAMVTVCQRAGVRSGDEFIIGSAMEKLEQNGKWAEATRLIKLAVDDGTVSFGNEEQNVLIAKRLIDSFRRESQWSGAIQALSWMSKADNAAAAAGLLATIELCADAGKWEAAAEIASRVFTNQKQKQQQQNNATAQIILQNQIISQKQKLQEEKDLEISQDHHHHHHHEAEMEEEEADSAVIRSESFYMTLIQVLSGAGRWQEAAKTFTEMVQDSHTKILSAKTACDAVLSVCDWHAALTFFQKALNWEPRILLAVSNYEAVVKACLASAKWREAVSVLRIQRRNGVELALPQIRTGMWASALTETTSLLLLVEEKKNKIDNKEGSSNDSTSSSSEVTQNNHNNNKFLPAAVPHWIACLRFYELIPDFRRTSGDTQLLADLASTLSNNSTVSTACTVSNPGDALRRALFAIATRGGGGNNNSGGHKPRKARR